MSTTQPNHFRIERKDGAHEWDASDYKTLRAEILGEFKNRNDEVKRAKDLEREIERLKGEIGDIKTGVNAERKFLRHMTDEELLAHIRWSLSSEDAACTREVTKDDVADLLTEIERLKKRQLPEGWHVAKLRNGAIAITRLEGECYVAEAENTYEAWSVNGHNLSDYSRDIIEIDGIPTKAGER